MRKDEINIESLSRIRKVEVSPFLFTKIQQSISEVTSNKFSGKVSLTLALGLILIAVLNVVIIENNLTPKNNETNLVESMNIITNNNIYNE